MKNLDIENLGSTIFNNLKLGIGVFSMDGKLVKANARLCEWLGYTLEELKSIKIFDLLFDDSVEKVKKNMRESVETPYQIQVKDRFGKQAWIEIFSSTIENNGNKFQVAAFRDISQQKKIEYEQRESDKQYRLLFENMNEAFALHKIITDENNKPIDFIYIDVNTSFEKITGLKKADIINKRVLEVIPAIEKYWMDNFGKVALTGVPDTFSNYMKPLDKFFETHTYSPQKEYFAVIFSDITDRWKTEIELELHNQRLEILVRLSEYKINFLNDLLFLCIKETTQFAKGDFGLSLLIDLDNNSELTTLWNGQTTFKLSTIQIEALKENTSKAKKQSNFYEMDEIIFNSLFSNELSSHDIPVDKLVGISLIGKSNIRLIHFIGLNKMSLSQSMEKHLVLLLESMLQIVEKQKYYEQIVKEKEKAVINESRFFEIQKAGKIGWYEALLKENKFLGSYETYNVFFDEYYDYAVSQNHLISAIHPDDREFFLNTVKNNIELKASEFEWEYRVVTPVRGTKYVHSKAFVNYDEQGNMIRRYGIVQDITEKKKIELELKRHNEQLESLFCIAQLTSSSSKELLDSALKEALSLTLSEIGFIFRYNATKDQFILDAYTYDKVDEPQIERLKSVNQEFKKAFISQLMITYQAVIINNFNENEEVKKKNVIGLFPWKNMMVVPIKIDAENMFGIAVANNSDGYSNVDSKQLTLLMDNISKVLERHNYQEELIKAKEKAEESDKLKSAFLANMSHEIRTPMNGIIGFSDLFVQENITPEKRRSYANIVIESGKQLMSIVDDILDFSKIEVGQISISKQPVIVNDVITELFSFYSPRAKDSNISLFPYKDLPDNLSIVITDKQRLVQVLNNLLSNAFKFTNKGQISFGYVKKNDYLEFFVKDTGSGIPLNMQKAVFERFRQLENQTIQKFRGTGLGLSISQKLVQLLGGEIYLESQENIGTSFFFTLPYYTENSEIQKNDNEEFSLSKPSNTQNTILIAEDEEINFMFLSEILSNSEKRILHAKNGLEAVEICKKHPEIDLVLMDVKMPEMDGLQATRIIRDFRNQLPIVIQSAFVMESDKETAFLAGATGFIAKPINKNQLLTLVNKFLLVQET